jgi:hypothetical protein
VEEFQPLPELIQPKPGDRVTAMGNSGEGKSEILRKLFRAQLNGIVLNTKRSAMYDGKEYGIHVSDTEKLMREYNLGRYVLTPEFDDEWWDKMENRERFFKWAMRWQYVNQKENPDGLWILVDEVTDICPSAQVYPRSFQKAIKQGREFGLGFMVGTQEPVRSPSFAFGQSQHRYVFFIGWDAHRKVAQDWYENKIPWELMPERSHKFLYKGPTGVYGPSKLNVQPSTRGRDDEDEEESMSA